MMGNRECRRCGGVLTEEDVIKVKGEDGSWVEIPLPLCPKCFTERMREKAAQRK